jgi:hypothetical protein
MEIYMKTITILLILGILISGCLNRPSDNIEKENKEDTSIESNESINNMIEEKENNSREDWFMTTYEGPTDEKNSEDARMSIIPHLRKLGWDGGINVAKSEKLDNYSIIIVLPFQLTNGSTNFINQTLQNFSFVPLGLNEKVVD